ncbi:hypothetical protein DESPIG_02761 [Desulfovibrio piger ATCC 29098]|uniref:Uncharacterized protein n=1 Tax=Desulfovibrio piger ATCC 29098 TaxID=411464 RepID=B6WXD5_9BACT|nr:hypothetical protein DESPIG_02761 [Desulfovibrio piger ATCC 29098]
MAPLQQIEDTSRCLWRMGTAGPCPQQASTRALARQARGKSPSPGMPPCNISVPGLLFCFRLGEPAG